MELDEELRHALIERSADRPSAVSLLDGVRTVRRRLARRRAYGAATLAVAVTLAVVLPIAWARPGGPHPPVVGTSPSPSPSPSVLPLAPIDLTVPAFPLVPSWEPPNAGTRFVGQRGAESDLSYSGMRLLVSVDVVPYEFDWEAGQTAPITVNGRPAQVRSGTDIDNGGVDVAVTWRLANGRYVTVEGIGALSVAEAERFARGLRAGSIPGTPTVADFAVAPAGYRLQLSDDQYTCVTEPADASARRSLTGVCAHVGPVTQHDTDPDATAVTVAGRPGVLIHQVLGFDHSLWTVRISLGGGRELFVFTAGMADGRQPLGRDDLLAIAAGITPRS